MISKYKIALSISVILTLFFLLPWITVIGELRFSEVLDNNIEVRDITVSAHEILSRFVFLATSVFVTSMLFFQYNFYWKNLWNGISIRWARTTLQVLGNVVIIMALSWVLVKVSADILNHRVTFYTFYLFRNIGIASVAMLVAYVYDMIERARIDRIKILTLHNEKTETELAALKMQIDPHFLFNSLNSLTGLIRENPREAISFVNHLSDTFRHVLDNREQVLVPLSEELSFLESYLYMMKVRFGEGLNIIKQVPEADMQKKMPQFGLQLLVENAVKHNIVSARKPLQIRITCQDGMILVENNLQLKRRLADGYGIGLASLTKHYELLSDKTIQVEKTQDAFKVYLPLL